MAASMYLCRNVCLSRLLNCPRAPCSSKHFIHHCYALSQDSTMNKKNKTKTAIDPKRDPYVTFVEGDPVQQSIVEGASNNSVPNGLKMTVIKKPTDVSIAAAKFKGDQKQKSKNKKKSASKSTATSKDALRAITGNDPMDFPEDSTIKNFKGVEYTSLAQQNDRRLVTNMIRVKTQKGREENREILLEGCDLVQTGLQQGLTLLKLYFSNPSVLFPLKKKGYLNQSDVELYHVPRRNLKIWLSKPDAQLVGVFQKPKGCELGPKRTTIPVTLVCERLTGPSLGSLIHSAAVVGCEQVIMMKDCGDIWDPLALVDGKGAQFSIPIKEKVMWSEIMDYLPATEKQFYVAGMDRKSEKNILGKSDPEEILDQIERAKEEEMFGNQEEIEVEDLNDYAISEDSEELEELEKEVAATEDKVPEIYKKAYLSVQPFGCVEFTGGHAVIVVSGERSGVSLPGRRVVHDNFGVGVELPSVGHVERLSPELSGIITVFEAAKQLHQKAALKKVQELDSLEVD